MKKLISAGLCAVLCLSLLVGSAFAEAGLGNFTKTKVYETGKFADVAASDWFNASVGAAYEYSLLLGVSQNEFGAAQNVTIAEVLTMAARLHCIYTNGSENLAESTPWYQTYVDYCVTNGIISDKRFSDFNAYASRTQVAEIFSKALPDSALKMINTIEDGAIPDLDNNTDTSAIYKLYRAGILTGEGTSGEFGPARSILRSEMAAVVTRMADESLRKSFTLKAYSEDSDITTDAQLKAALELGKTSVANAYQTCAYAQSMKLDNAVGLSMKATTMQELLAAGKHAANAQTFCKDKAEYAGIYESIEKAVSGCAATVKIVSALRIGSTNTDWNAAFKYIEACDEAFRLALGEKVS